MMKLYNTLTRTIEVLNPLNSNEVTVYTCGPTVYGQPHIGNWVGYIYWDVLQRTLQAEGLTVKRVQNYTDVGHLVSDDDSGEDKMEKGARAEGITAWQVAEKYIDIVEHEGYEQLELIRPTLIRATSCIDEQIDFVKELEAKEFTYTIESEGVYFDSSKLKDYGKLARLDIKGLKQGARIEVAGKRNPTDFALWKFSPKDAKRDMEWDSPWGKGFPGWHLECSVIARENLGDQIDIHCGGVDHIAVHHTNEIAQTESVTGKQFAQIWVHNNHLKVDGGKMSKSLGNIYTLQDILEKGYSLDAFKLMILGKHYRTEGNFTWEILEAAQNRLNNWRAMADRIWQLPPQNDDDSNAAIIESLQNDLNSPEALSLIEQAFDLCEKESRAPSRELIELIANTLGIKLLGDDISPDQKALIEERQKARTSSDWSKSDKIRDSLKEQGVELNDTKEGTLWFRV
jgi:cysteinyl-tRNA synthetase